MPKTGLTYSDKVRDSLYKLEQEGLLTLSNITDTLKCGRQTAVAIRKQYEDEKARGKIEAIKSINLDKEIKNALAKVLDELSQELRESYNKVKAQNDEIVADNHRLVDELAETKLDLDDAKLEIKKLDIKYNSNNEHWQERYNELLDKEEQLKTLLTEVHSKYSEADKLRAVAEKERDLLREQIKEPNKKGSGNTK